MCISGKAGKEGLSTPREVTPPLGSEGASAIPDNHVSPGSSTEVRNPSFTPDPQTRTCTVACSQVNGCLLKSRTYLPVCMCVCVCVTPPEIYPLGNFPTLSTVLLTLTCMLYIRSLDLFLLHNCTFTPLTNIFPFPPPPHPLVTTALLPASM